MISTSKGENSKHTHEGKLIVNVAAQAVLLHSHSSPCLTASRITWASFKWPISSCFLCGSKECQSSFVTLFSFLWGHNFYDFREGESEEQEATSLRPQDADADCAICQSFAGARPLHVHTPKLPGSCCGPSLARPSVSDNGLEGGSGPSAFCLSRSFESHVMSPLPCLLAGED